MRLKMAGIHVDDPLQAFAFYTQVLGLKELMYLPDAMLAIVTGTGQDVGLLLEPSTHPVAKAYREGLYNEGIPSFVMGVPDVAAEVERLKAKGVRFSQEAVSGPHGTTAIFDDTCGNYITLHQD